MNIAQDTFARGNALSGQVTPGMWGALRDRDDALAPVLLHMGVCDTKTIFQPTLSGNVFEAEDTI